MGRGWSNYRLCMTRTWLTVCQQIYEMCWACFSSYRPRECSSLSAQYVAGEESLKIYISRYASVGCCCCRFLIYSVFFVVAGLWAWVPWGCRWEDMGFGKFFLYVFLYIFEDFYMFTSANREMIQIWKRNTCNACFLFKKFYISHVLSI